MSGYVILTNRKRAIIALAHSAAFLLLAVRGLAGAVRPLAGASPVSAWTMFGLYMVVSSILLALTVISGAALERLYFAFCAASATSGLLRSILGDPRMHLAVYIRVAMLVCAFVTGLILWRAYPLAQPASAMADTSDS